MAKKDKPTKEKSKVKQDGGTGGVSKKKSDKVNVSASENVEKQQLDLQNGIGGNEPIANAKSGSISSKDGHAGDIQSAARLKNFSPPEWNSEVVRNSPLLIDGFSCCIVLVMEDSPDLTRFGEFLLRAVETGVRRKFHCISGAQTAERVKHFLASHAQPVDDHIERQDLFAEAIKHTLLGIKETVATEIDADHQTKEMELAGARSKDLIRYVPPLTIPVVGDIESLGGNGDGDGIREAPPAPPPTEQNLHQPQSQPTSKKLVKSKNMIDETESKTGGVASAPSPTKMGVKTRMRKRGEVPMPEFEIIDDSPPKGPRSFILLQGFYNPSLIEELRKIGVKVDGILLMTDAKVNRYNFSIIDVEDSIPGTFKPKNVLPQYLKMIEQVTMNAETRNSEVTQFWIKLSDMYNTATTDSPFHDIALMNFPLPDSKRINLESSDGITYYISKVYDEVAKRVYEMLVLEEWFQEFSSAADVTKLQPLEPALPREIYDQIVGQIPTECISVPIILEAVVQQVAHSLEIELGNPVPEPCYEEDITAGIITGKSSFGRTDWGSVASKSDESKRNVQNENPKRAFGSTLFKIPMYIKAGDYASIRSCHLNENLASKIAACQLSGDMRNIQGFLWQKVPEFNRGLYMKLLGNLNHFMYFLPPDTIQFEDMFYILHLLMSAGVEIHLQKAAAQRRASVDPLKPNSILYKDGIYRHNRTETKFPGTNLNTDHNYLAVNQKSGLHFVIAPNSNHDLTVAAFGHSPTKANTEPRKDAESKAMFDNMLKEAQQQQQTLPPSDAEQSETQIQKKLKRKKSRSNRRQTDQTLDINKAARVTAVGAIQTAVKYAHNQNEATDNAETEILEKRKGKEGKGKAKSKGKKGKGKEGESVAEEEKSAADFKGTEDAGISESKIKSNIWGEEKQDIIQDPSQGAVEIEGERNAPITVHNTKNPSTFEDIGTDTAAKPKSGFANMNYPSKETKRFIACEEQWFEDITDASVIQALLECPALLAISESGALDLSKWIEKYLLSAGMDVTPGEGVLLGDLKNWNFVEELVPIQTVQLLNQASQDYLSMQRMYCPFYDTLLFIFNNPMPRELTAESQFYFRLKTLPGFQHFLEYTMDDKSVLRWIEQLDAGKRLEVGEQTSINALLNIIPEEQWLMVPSIKYQIMVDNQRSLSAALSGGSIAANRTTFYGKIESYGKATGSDPSGSKKSVVPSATSGVLSRIPSAGEIVEAETVTSDQITTVQDPTISVESGSNVNDNPKSGAASTKGLSVKNSVKTKSDKGDTKLETATNKLDKKGTGTARNSQDTGTGGIPDPTAASQNLSESAAENKEDKDSNHMSKEKELIKSSLNFSCYDLGKRVAVVGNDTFFLFPMDGTVIRYDISTIEPEFRMMQLTVTKNGHQTFFYPYYIPHDFDLSSEDYVVCPYFHMVLSNGTIFAFQDMRAEEAAPYLKIAMNKKNQDQLFSFEKVLFGKEVEKKLNEVATAAEKGEDLERVGSDGSRKSDKGSDGKRKKSKESMGSAKKAESVKGGENQEEDNPADETHSLGKLKSKKNLKEKKSKKLHDKSPDENKKDKKDKKGGKKEKDKKGKGNKAETEEEENDVVGASAVESSLTTAGEIPEEIGDETTADEENVPAPPPTSESEDILGGNGVGGEWMYPSSENSEDEAETQKRRLFFAPPWDEAVQLIQPMAHTFTTTLPSGLMATVEDIPGPPLTRIVKQNYVGHGSAKSNIEGTRYYTMDGSVVKFLLNGTIQILTARGVTTTIDELAVNAKRDFENISSIFGSATIVKIFNGEVILPNGQLWQVVNGKKVVKTPIYVFTTGSLTGGEIFRRRQDGVVYLHRNDGTVITHYPDGTRFTTRMVILEKGMPNLGAHSAPETSTNMPPQEPMEEDTDEEFSDWVFVGLKYMIEHPNYCTILFNTLSGNAHLKLPHGEWVRVFADGNIRISTEDRYCLDVDKNRALLSYPPCATEKQALPNLTAVRLWHSAPPNQPEDFPQSSQIGTGEGPGRQATAGPSGMEVQMDLPSGFEEKETMDTQAAKKKSKNIHNSKSLHPKVKQREGTKSRARATRQGSTLISRDSVLVKGDISSVDKRSGEGEGDLRKGSQHAEETSNPFEVLNTLLPPQQYKTQPRKPSMRKSDGLLSEFLKFEDETTFCKAVDSWDNRFLMNVYGGALVDKIEKSKLKQEMGTQQLIETLSEHSQLPGSYISGILRNTSSENLQDAARRLQALRKGYSNSCSGDLPNTKIFVVKRDLSAIQYLQKAQVNDVMTKAYSSRESMVIVDPVPKRHPRKFITIMRPVEEMEEPHGMWTRSYIEPMFRPRGVTNKHLKVATPNDLRWFGYILNSAHGKRPKFVQDPKEEYKEKKSLQMRAEIPGSSESPQEEQGGRGLEMGDTKKDSEEEGYSGEVEEEEENGMPEEEEFSEVQSTMLGLEDDKKKKKKEKKEKEKEGGKKGKGKDKKGKGVKGSTLNTTDEETEEIIGEAELNEEGYQLMEFDPITGMSIRKSKKSVKSNLQGLEPEINDYPNEIEDIRGIYEMERERRSSNAPRITAKQHSTPCNTKKAIVVRAFVEIPRVDESMQRALLAASMSYAETCKTEAAIFKTYKTEDPRTPEEKVNQAGYKQQMIEQNIGDMHLLEQKPGPVLKFHF